jgi:Cu/Ag efflux pump CusA
MKDYGIKKFVADFRYYVLWGKLKNLNRVEVELLYIVNIAFRIVFFLLWWLEFKQLAIRTYYRIEE